MADLKTEAGGQYAWQGQRFPAPMAPRQPVYDTNTPQPPVVLPYHGVARTTFTDYNNGPQPTELPSPMRREPPTLSARPGLTTHHSYPSLKRSYHALEGSQSGDRLSEQYDAAAGPDDTLAKPGINPDHRLLSFGRVPDRHTILDHHGRPRSLEVSAQIHGMFFLSEIATNSGDAVVIQPELTCYRRNLFQISGSVSGPRGALSVVTEQGETVPIVSQELAVSAMESVDNHVIRLIVIPWKTPPPNSPEMPTNQEHEPLPIPIFSQGETTGDVGDVIVQSIAWRRLQFRVATANNGRRKELQQHFVLRLHLNAVLASGAKMCLAECTTAPIVVRGRSPRNFQARKEIPLLGSASTSRAHAIQSTISNESADATGDRARPAKPRSLDLPKRPFQFDASNFPPSPVLVRNSYGQWSSQPSGHSSIATTPTYPPPQVPIQQFHQSINPIAAEMPPVHATPIMPPQATNPAMMVRPAYYPSTAAAPMPPPVQYMDNNPRPLKSPRHQVVTESSSLPNYPGFEERLQPAFQSPSQQPDTKEYFPVVQSQGQQWSSEQPSTVYKPVWQHQEQSHHAYGASNLPLPPLAQQHYGYLPGQQSKNEAPLPQPQPQQHYQQHPQHPQHQPQHHQPQHPSSHHSQQQQQQQQQQHSHYTWSGS